MDFGLTAKLTNKKLCTECWRTFDLMVEDDAQEFYYGHDCEDVSEKPAGGALGVSQG